MDVFEFGSFACGLIRITETTLSINFTIRNPCLIFVGAYLKTFAIKNTAKFSQNCKDYTFRLGSLSSGHSGMQTQEALDPSALQTRPAPQWILTHGSTIRGVVLFNKVSSISTIINHFLPATKLDFSCSSAICAACSFSWAKSLFYENVAVEVKNGQQYLFEQLTTCFCSICLKSSKSLSSSNSSKSISSGISKSWKRTG